MIAKVTGGGIAVAILVTGLVLLLGKGCSGVLPPAGPNITNLFPTTAPTTTPTINMVSQSFSQTAAFNGINTVQAISPNGNISVTIDNTLTNVTINGTKSTPGPAGPSATTRLSQIEIVAQPFPAGSNTLRIEAIIPIGTGIVSDRADFTIGLPGGANLELTTGNGTIAVDGNTGVVVARTSNGAVTVINNRGNVNATTTNAILALGNITGSVTGSTSNAIITVSARPGVGGTINLVNSNGAINLEVPTTTPATLILTANNGTVNATLTGFATTGVQQPSAGALTATLNGGNGGGQIFASTSNAAITFAGNSAIP